MTHHSRTRCLSCEKPLRLRQRTRRNADAHLGNSGPRLNVSESEAIPNRTVLRSNFIGGTRGRSGFRSDPDELHDDTPAE